jgi:hypothetical protein
MLFITNFEGKDTKPNASFGLVCTWVREFQVRVFEYGENFVCVLLGSPQLRAFETRLYIPQKTRFHMWKKEEKFWGVFLLEFLR